MLNLIELSKSLYNKLQHQVGSLMIKTNNAAYDTFHSAGEEPSPHHQSLVQVIPHDTTKTDNWITKTFSTNINKDDLASKQQQLQPRMEGDS